MKITVTILSAMAFLLFTACSHPADKQTLQNEILQIHQDLIDAHLKQDPGFFIEGLSPDHVVVKNGEISNPAREEILADMEKYVMNTTFTEYRDLREPIIGFSEDGTIAWSIVQVKVQGERKQIDGSLSPVDFTCAWVTIYERDGKKWKTVVEASTFK